MLLPCPSWSFKAITLSFALEGGLNLFDVQDELTVFFVGFSLFLGLDNKY